MKSLLLLPLWAAAMVFVLPAGAENGADIRIGKHLYLSYCMLCHGDDGKTRGPLAVKLGLEPADLTTGRLQGKKTDELAAIIGGYGRKLGSNMPLWEKAIPENNLRHIAAYLLSLSAKRTLPKGDPRRGMAIFKSACMACHGQAGDGKGVLAQLIGMPMVDFTAISAQDGNESAFIKAVNNGKGSYMPSWKGVLAEREIDDVVAYISGLNKQATKR